jgi:hypothetical protein
VFENRVLRRTFGPEREEVIGGWRTLHNEKVLTSFCSPNKKGDQVKMGELNERDEKCVQKFLIEF